MGGSPRPLGSMGEGREAESTAGHLSPGATKIGIMAAGRNTANRDSTVRGRNFANVPSLLTPALIANPLVNTRTAGTRGARLRHIGNAG